LSRIDQEKIKNKLIARISPRGGSQRKSARIAKTKREAEHSTKVRQGQDANKVTTTKQAAKQEVRDSKQGTNAPTRRISTRGKNKKTLAEKADAEKDSPKRDGKSNSEKSGADGDCPTRGGRSARGTSKTKGRRK
jgi:hypothetical protein